MCGPLVLTIRGLCPQTRMFSHIVLGTNDLSRAIIFYDEVMAKLGYARPDTGGTHAGYGKAADTGGGSTCPWTYMPLNGKAATCGNGTNVALLAENRQAVDTFHEAAIVHGGQDEGAPGLRTEVHPHFYAAYCRDPDGHKLLVVCHEDLPDAAAFSR